MLRNRSENIIGVHTPEYCLLEDALPSEQLGLTRGQTSGVCVHILRQECIWAGNRTEA